MPSIVIRYWYGLVEICPQCVQKASISNQLRKIRGFWQDKCVIKVWDRTKICSWLKLLLGTPWHYLDMAVWSWYIFDGKIHDTKLDFNNIFENQIFSWWIIPTWSLKNKEVFRIGLLDRPRVLFRIGSAQSLTTGRESVSPGHVISFIE